MSHKVEFQDPIDEISGGYRASQILLTANRLGLFTTLGQLSMNIEELVSALGTDLRATRILCDALVTLRILEKREKSYRNSSIALEYLLPDSPFSKQAMLLHSARLYERWGHLYDTVRSGQPASEESIPESLKEDERAFAQAMADIARLSAQQTVDLLELSGAQKMLDVGGGPGLYAIAFVQKYPELQAVVLDNEKTLEVTLENIKQAGLSHRISVCAGDLFADSLGERYDFILVSNVIHSYSFDQNIELVKKCADALLPGGRLCIKDFILDPDRTAPEWCALFAVNMLVNTEAGDCFTAEEVAQWFVQAGLTLDSVLIQTPQTKLICGKK